MAENKSSAEIAKLAQCSISNVNYWLGKYHIPKRSISDAIYTKRNPNGDPFKVSKPSSVEDAKLFGLGLGLYWGEGNKLNKHSVRLGNTDPHLVKRFIEFLERICGIDQNKLRFGLQIFSDISPIIAKKFWCNMLNVPAAQFQKIIVTPARSLGTYRNKSQYGVLTVYYNNKKLRDIINKMIDDLKI